jgi:hypothetical protein
VKGDLMPNYTLKMMPREGIETIIDKLIEDNLNYNMSIYDGATLIYVEDNDLKILMEFMHGLEGLGLKVKNSIYNR